MLAAGFCMAAEQHPDFTGVWTNAGGPGIGGATNTAPAAPPPLKPEAKARIDAYQKLVAKSGDSPGGWCLGTGMPGSMLGSGGYPMEIIQRPEQITIIYEAHSETRRVYFGSRNAAEADKVPGRNGYSSGHWEGDTLVVETNNIRAGTIDRDGIPYSDKLTVVERIRRVSPTRLEIETVLTDPEAFLAPYTIKRAYTPMPPGSRFEEYLCENNRDL